MRHGDGLVEGAFHPHIRRQVRLELVEHPVDSVAHVEDVLRFLLVSRHEDGALAVVPAEIGRLFRRPAHLRHIAHAHDVAAEIADHGVADTLDAVVAAGRLEVEAPGPCVDRTARQFGGFGAHGVCDRRHGNAEVRETAKIDRHADFRTRQAPGLRIADARHAVDFVGEVVGEVFQHAVRRRLRNERHLHDIGKRRAELVDVEAADAGRKRRAERVYLAHHVVILLVRIGRPVELHLNNGESVLGAALDLVEVVQPVYRVLDGADYELLDVGRIRPRQCHVDDGERPLHVGIFGARDGVEGVEAHRDQHGEDDERELPVSDGEGADAADVHGRVASSAGAVSARAAFRSVTTRTFTPSRR